MPLLEALERMHFLTFFQLLEATCLPWLVVLRQARTWDPLLQCCHACTWTNLSSSNKIQRNCMGLKITACMCTWGKFWTKDTKRPKNPTATFEEPGAKAGYCACPLHTTPPKGWAKHLCRPSGPTPGHTPCKEQARPPSPAPGSKPAREPVVCSHSPLLQQGPQ